MPNQRDKTSLSLICPFPTKIPSSHSLELHWCSQYHSFTFLSVQATCCQPSFFLLKAHLSGSQGFAKIKHPEGDSLCLHITTPKRCSRQKLPPTEVLPSLKSSLQEKAGLAFHTIFETMRLSKYEPLPLRTLSPNEIA